MLSSLFSFVSLAANLIFTSSEILFFFFFSGILDRPSLPSSIEEVSYKLHISGRSGVGKTATVARLHGIKCPSTYVETAGIRKSNIYWPVKIWDKIILFKLQFWDAGDNSIKKYSHILPVCC
jgi:GTPase SAR1 family protein